MDIRLPQRCVIELHYRCNLSCRTCNIWKKEFLLNRRRDGFNHFHDWLSIQNKLARAGIQQVVYVGGEPLLTKGIFKLIEDANNHGLSVVLVTNGSCLRPDSLNKLMRSGLHTIIFSLDGTEEIHDSIRGEKGTFETVVQSITHIQRVKKLKKIKKPRVCIYTTISKLNFKCIPSILSIAQKTDVNSIRFQLISVVTRRISDQASEVFQRDVVGYHSYAIDCTLKPSTSDLREVRDNLTEAGRWSKEVGIGLQIENVLMYPPVNRICSFIKSSFVVNPFGEVLPCPMLPGYSIGNILKTDLNCIWGNEAHSDFLKRLNCRRKLAICRECCVEKI